jgi:hypothetical protein
VTLVSSNVLADEDNVPLIGVPLRFTTYDVTFVVPSHATRSAGAGDAPLVQNGVTELTTNPPGGPQFGPLTSTTMLFDCVVPEALVAATR